jgi:hypothetical protein
MISVRRGTVHGGDERENEKTINRPDNSFSNMEKTLPPGRAKVSAPLAPAGLRKSRPRSSYHP